MPVVHIVRTSYPDPRSDGRIANEGIYFTPSAGQALEAARKAAASFQKVDYVGPKLIDDAAFQMAKALGA